MSHYVLINLTRLVLSLFFLAEQLLLANNLLTNEIPDSIYSLSNLCMYR